MEHYEQRGAKKDENGKGKSTGTKTNCLGCYDRAPDWINSSKN